MLQWASAVGLCSVRFAAKSNRLRVQQLMAIGPGGAEGTAEGQEAEAVGVRDTAWHADGLGQTQKPSC